MLDIILNRLNLEQFKGFITYKDNKTVYWNNTSTKNPNIAVGFYVIFESLNKITSQDIENALTKIDFNPTKELLKQLREKYPEIRIWPSHYSIHCYLEKYKEGIDIKYNGSFSTLYTAPKHARKGIKVSGRDITLESIDTILTEFEKICKNLEEHRKKLADKKEAKVKQDFSPLGVVKNFLLEENIKFTGGEKEVYISFRCSSLRIYKDLDIRLNERRFNNKNNLADPSNKKINSIFEIIKNLRTLDELSESLS